MGAPGDKAGRARHASVMKRSEELEGLVVAWFAAASAGDPSLVERHVPVDTEVMLIGSDPDEWVEGGAAVAAFLRGEVEGSGGNATFTPSDTVAYEDGDVGWAATRVTITLPDGTHIRPGGPACSVGATECGPSCRRTHRSRSRTTTSAGSTAEGGRGVRPR